MESEADTASSADDTVNAYLMLGNIHLAFVDLVRAYAYYEEGLEASRKAGMPDNEIKFLNDLAIVSCYQGNRDKAVKFNEMLADVPAIDKPMQRYLHLITSAYIERLSEAPTPPLRRCGRRSPLSTRRAWTGR